MLRASSCDWMSFFGAGGFFAVGAGALYSFAIAAGTGIVGIIGSFDTAFGSLGVIAGETGLDS